MLHEGMPPHLFEAFDAWSHSAAGFEFLFGGKSIGSHEFLDEALCSVPVEEAERVAARNERRAGIEHFVLQMARAEFGADRVPGQLHQLDAFVPRLAIMETLGLVDDRVGLAASSKSAWMMAP